MRLLHVIYASSCLTLFCSTLPLNVAKPLEREFLARRVVYSVVDVDGGAAASTRNSQAAATKTILATATETKTIVLTGTPSAQTIEVTRTVSQPGSTKTVDKTVVEALTPTCSSKTASTFAVVNANQNAASQSGQVDIVSSMTYSSTSSSWSQIITVINVPSVSSPTPLHSQPYSTTNSVLFSKLSRKGASSTLHVQQTTASTVSFSSATTTAADALSMTSTTYDNGLWHTSYPHWNATSPVLSLSLRPSSYVPTSTFTSWLR